MSRVTYSIQIKELFIEHRKNGKTLEWITDAMNISLNTIKVWSALLKRWESLDDKRAGNGRKKLFSNESLELYVKDHINATLKDIGNHFSVSEVAVWKRLKWMSYSYKKKR